MVVDVSIKWKESPKSGRVELSDGALRGLNAMIGAGHLEGDRFYFTNTGPCHMFFELSADTVDSPSAPTAVRVVDTGKPFAFAVKDALATGELELPEVGVTVIAREDVWSSL